MLVGSVTRATLLRTSHRHAPHSAALILSLGGGGGGGGGGGRGRDLPWGTATRPGRERQPRARPYSAAASPEPQQAPASQPPPPPAAATDPRDHAPSPSAANPPPTTRPPPLTLPPRPPNAPGFFSSANLSYLVARGVAYLSFYKTGIKHIYANTRLLYPSSSSSSPQNPDRPYPSTRAHLQLRQRWRHDVRRLPLFALVLLVCGEFTPLVVLALPRIVPLPCRIPAQVEKLLRVDEAARRAARESVGFGVGVGGSPAAEGGEARGQVPAAVLAAVLGIKVTSWTPSFLLAPRVQRRLRFLAVDDALLIQAGGAPALVADEVRLACADRGIDVLGRGDEELRAALAKWLRLTDARRLGEDGREKAVMRLLLAKEADWGE